MKITDFKQYHKDYYEKNKEAMLAYGCNKIECPSCGRTVSRNQMIRHKKTNICAKNSLMKTAPDEPNLNNNDDCE
jgi:hypothetical protein